jgi:glycosyltransferase involved in cell wall biosynthesis
VSLRVLSVAYPFARVGPDAVGGAEQVLTLLDGALAAAGHATTVIAAAGSTTAGRLLATPWPGGCITEPVRQRAWATHRQHIEEALAQDDFDLVHMHGIDFHRYLPRQSPAPVLATLHLPPSWYPPECFAPRSPNVHLHCVSAAQQRSCPQGVRLLPWIGNGVPVEALAASCSKRRFVVVLGRICPEKNVHVALEAGRRAGWPVLLAGQVFPYEAHQRYFREQVLPKLGAYCRFLGPVGFARKRRLLAAARCVLLPSLAPETSSLVAMEAMACGTPVVAYASGALPEIVEHGVTGFLVRDAAGMEQAIEACGALSPACCRSAARERFSLDRMVAKYLEVYGQLARGTARQAVCIA